MKQIYSQNWWLGIPILLIMGSCEPNNVGPTPKEIDGWAPVYSTNTQATAIKAEQARNVENAGKIYVKGNILYQVEIGKGVHVIDISQPASPQKLGFITIQGAQEMAIKDNYLYANNLNDLVVVDVTGFASVKEVNRMKNVFHLVNQELPPASGYFECIDATKGTVVGWEQKLLKRPKCRKD